MNQGFLCFCECKQSLLKLSNSKSQEQLFKIILNMLHAYDGAIYKKNNITWVKKQGALNMKIYSMFLRFNNVQVTILHYIIKIIRLKIIYLYTIVNVFDFLVIYNTV